MTKLLTEGEIRHVQATLIFGTYNVDDRWIATALRGVRVDDTLLGWAETKTREINNLLSAVRTVVNVRPMTDEALSILRESLRKIGG